MLQVAQTNRVRNKGGFLSSTIWLYVLKLSGVILPLFTVPYITRVLGVETYGTYTFVNGFTAYFVLFIDFGFILSATKAVTEQQSNKEALSNVLCSVTCAKLLISVVSIAIAGLLCFIVPALQKNFWYAFLSVAAVAFTSLAPDFFYRGLERMQGVALRYLLARGTATALVFVFIKEPKDLILLPAFNAGGEILGAVMAWSEIIFLQKIKLKIPPFTHIIGAIKDSAKYFYSRFAIAAYTNTNAFVIGLFSPIQAGLFGIAVSVAGSIKGAYAPLSDSLFPYMVRSKNFKALRILLLFSIPLSLVVATLLYFLAPLIIRIIAGEGYAAAVPLLRLCIPSVIIALPYYLLGYPALSPLGLSHKANSSVVCAAVFHLFGIGILAVFGRITPASLILLTLVTESIALSLRLYYLLSFTRKTHKGAFFVTSG
ncbi:MAG: oligosaccharide flippase family protein [Christensenellaceae bacterium]|jgi:PST family polysaccharide transporter|nr:oligosaccharide flippase family protein [Christensenellaceae bacterium]